MLTLFQDGKAPVELTVKSHRKHKNFDLLSFEGHPSINDVEKYRDGILKVSKDNSVDLAENEFYYHEIIGLHVLEDGTELGKVKEILSPGANDVWVVQRPKKLIYCFHISLLSSKEVDLEAGVVRVEIPEGLIDDED